MLGLDSNPSYDQGRSASKFIHQPLFSKEDSGAVQVIKQQIKFLHEEKHTTVNNVIIGIGNQPVTTEIYQYKLPITRHKKMN